jgi:hypothetical protein
MMLYGQKPHPLGAELPFFIDVRMAPHGRGPSPAREDTMASTRRRKLKKLRMKKANHGKRPLAGK